MEREWLEREQRIVRYCAGRMAAVEQEAFESELLDDSELAGDVQLAMLLRDALQHPEPGKATSASLASRWRSPWLALAAGVALGAVGLDLLRGRDDGRAYADVEYLTLGVVRSADPQLTTAASRVGEHSLLILEVPAEHSVDRIELLGPDGSRQTLPGTRDQGYLRIALTPPVATGDYVAVSGEVRYGFRIESRTHRD